MMNERQWHIEERIKPLVDALNETGILSTFSSCEAHFDGIETDEFQRKESAVVCATKNAETPEHDLERFFGYLLYSHYQSASQWEATLSIHKRYTVSKDMPVAVDGVYDFLITPFQLLQIDAQTRRSVTDLVIAETTSHVRSYRELKEK